MIQKYWLKVKATNYQDRHRATIATILILVALAAFGLGRLSVGQEGNANIVIEDLGLEAEFILRTGEIVASKNGSRYYYSWCGSAGRISDENKIYFETTDDAKAAGYTLAKNCK